MRSLYRIALLFLVTFAMMGADSSTTQLDRIDHKLVCQCGCGQILGECNHVGCPMSGPMIDDLRGQLTAGQPESAVLASFVAKYGPIVLAAPIRGGFDIVAWVVPFAILVIGIAGVILLLRVWKRRNAAFLLTQPAAPAPTIADDALRDRIRNETHYGE
jgi:cytochrome c-type biogenesis protein CcmH